MGLSEYLELLRRESGLERPAFALFLVIVGIDEIMPKLLSACGLLKTEVAEQIRTFEGSFERDDVFEVAWIGGPDMLSFPMEVGPGTLSLVQVTDALTIVCLEPGIGLVVILDIFLGIEDGLLRSTNGQFRPTDIQPGWHHRSPLGRGR